MEPRSNREWLEWAAAREAARSSRDVSILWQQPEHRTMEVRREDESAPTERNAEDEKRSKREAATREAGFEVVKVAQGWAVHAPSGGLLEWEDGSPRIQATREAALDMAEGTLRYTRIAATTFALMDD